MEARGGHALHIHLSFCSCYSLVSLCSPWAFSPSSLLPAVVLSPRTPSWCILSPPFLSPTALPSSSPSHLHTSEPSVVKLTLRWTRLWLFTNAVWYSAKKSVKVMSWSIYYQDTPLIWLATFPSAPVSKNEQWPSVPNEIFTFKSSQRVGVGQCSG